MRIAEFYGRERGGRQRLEIVLPVLNPLQDLEVLARVLVSNDLWSEFVKSGIAIGVIEVPMRIDEVGHGLRTE